MYNHLSEMLFVFIKQSVLLYTVLLFSLDHLKATGHCSSNETLGNIDIVHK